MKDFILLLTLFGISTAIVIPRKGHDGDGPDCGARSSVNLKVFKPRPIHKEVSFMCEMCLDLVEIAEMYADCDEAYVNQKLDKKCDSYFHSGFLDTACRDMINEIIRELKADTDKDPG
uniref:Saposin B-type domain-containing protein n=1 Tax=Panagrolaimus sp. ES5 TaxID=591445 RepID=A0AC34F1V6_9BILA